MLTTSSQLPPSARARRAQRRNEAIAARSTAFTLVELLMVLVILALLIAILTPSFQGIRHQATSVRCRSNLHQISMAFAMRRVDAEVNVSGLGGGRSYYPTGDNWPAVPYGSCKQPAIFGCPSIGDVMGDGQIPDAPTLLKQIVYYCRNRDYYIVLNEPQYQGWGHAGLGVWTSPNGKRIEFCLDDTRGEVINGLNQGDDGAVIITLDTYPPEAELTDCGCPEHNCLLYNGKPMFPQRKTGPIDPPEWSDPGSVGTNGYYGYTGDKRKVGMKVPLSGLRCDYGINKDACLMRAGETKAVVMDFDENNVMWEAADINTKLVRVADRHAGNINVLMGGGDVRTMTPLQMNPLMPETEATLWKP